MFLCNVKGLTLYRTWAGVFGHNREAVHPYINGGSTTGIVIDSTGKCLCWRSVAEDQQLGDTWLEQFDDLWRRS